MAGWYLQAPQCCGLRSHEAAEWWVMMGWHRGLPQSLMVGRHQAVPWEVMAGRHQAVPWELTTAQRGGPLLASS